MSHAAPLACIRCNTVLATVERGQLCIDGLRVRVIGTAWLYCPAAACGGWCVYHPRAVKANVV